MLVTAPTFEARFLLPKFWPTWISIVLLYIISWLPYPVQKLIGRGLGWLLGKLAVKRVRIAERNLALCFPDMPEAERTRIVKENQFNAGMALLEAGMGWWWPDWRIKKHSTITGIEHVRDIVARGKGVFALAPHMMNLEFLCRAVGIVHPAIALYRRHNNPLMEYMQYHGRARSNKYMIHKRDVSTMIKALNEAEFTFYLPDQDYGRNRAVFVPFFAVPDAATTTGTLLFANEANCETVFMLPIRTARGYELRITPGLKDFPSGDDIKDVTRVNQHMEQMILQAPEQYLWMHKRFKTRPDEGAPSLYD